MAINTLPYFYDGQLRRVLLQFMRLFSGFKVKTGKDADGFNHFINVPVVYGDGSKQAQTIINNNSENIVNSVPKISCYIQSVVPDRTRQGYQGNYSEELVTERKFNRETNQYGDKRGNSYEVDRLMPQPITITMQVDVWSSNTEQKFQLFEQIYMLFNPSLDMQTTTNPLDWSSLHYVELKDVNWDNVGVPKADEDLNVMTFTFDLASYISPPARVKKQTLIHTIIEEIGFGHTFEDMQGWGPEDVVYNIITPNDACISVVGNEITLLGKNANVHDQQGNIYSWPQLIDLYGELKPAYSKIRLRWNNILEDDAHDLIGFIDYHPTEDNKLIVQYSVETLPQITLQSIDKFINPHFVAPGSGLPAAALGQRYIITDEVGPGSVAWLNLDAQPNDIIEYNGTDWIKVFDASANTTLQILTDSSTGKYYKILDTNTGWQDLINIIYRPGYFRLLI